MDEERLERTLRARWQSQPALTLAEARARWGDHPWPDLIRYRVISFPGDARRDHLVAHICHSLSEARRYVADLRKLGVGPQDPYRREIRILRAKLAPSHVIVKTSIPVLVRSYEPPHVIRLIALVCAPTGRVKACYANGRQRRFASLRDCLASYHRDVAWLARREAYHLRGA
jgi:hypothetical protein